MRDSELERTNVMLPEEEKQIVKESGGYGALSSACQRGVLAEARGEEYVAADEMRKLARSQWEDTEEGIESVLSALETSASDGGAVTMERVHEEFDAFREERRTAITEPVQDSVSEAVQEHVKEQQEEFESLLVELEDLLRQGNHVFVGHGQVKDAAKLDNSEPEDIIDLLKQRNPEIPDYAFESVAEADRRWWGIDDREMQTATDGGRADDRI